MKVTDPSGQTWRVSRRWAPWRPRLRDVGGAAQDAAWWAGDPADVAIWMFFFVLSVLAPLLLALAFAPVELALLAVALPVAVLGRVVFGRKWHVEVRRGWRPWTEVLAGSWAQSGIRIVEIAGAVRRGDLPERTLPEAGWPPSPRSFT